MNLRELWEIEFCCEGMRSVLGRDELEAHAVGISARKGSEINLELNVCQVVNNKTFDLSEMRIACSNQAPRFVVRTLRWRSKKVRAAVEN